MDTDILKIIKTLLTREGVTAYRMNKDFGFAHGTISRLLGGKGNLTWQTILRITDYLGYEIRFVKKKKEMTNGNDL